MVVSCVGQQVQQTSTPLILSIRDPRVALVGRYGAMPSSQHAAFVGVRIGYPGAGFVVSFHGGVLALRVSSSSGANALTVVVDHGEPKLLLLTKGEQVVPLVEQGSAENEEDHLVQVYKRSETWQGLIDLEALLPGPGTELLQAPPLPVRKILFLGDSVTCGAGVARDVKCTSDPAKPNEDPYHAFDMVLGRRLDAQVELVCYGGRGLQRDYRGMTRSDGIVNAREFLDLAIATDAPETRQRWDARQWVPDAVMVELGTNDFNLQKTEPLAAEAFVGEYLVLLRRLRVEYPHAVILATEGPIVTDPLLRTYVRQAVKKMNDSRIVWAPGKHYPGNACDGHPTQVQAEHMAEDFEPLLRKELGW